MSSNPQNGDRFVEFEARTLAGIGAESDSPIDQRPTDSNRLGEEVVLRNLGAGHVAHRRVDTPTAEFDIQLVIGCQGDQAVRGPNAHQTQEPSISRVEVELEMLVGAWAH